MPGCGAAKQRWAQAEGAGAKPGVLGRTRCWWCSLPNRALEPSRAGRRSHRQGFLAASLSAMLLWHPLRGCLQQGWRFIV